VLAADGAACGRSGIQSSVKTSIPFFSAPKNGTAFKAVSASPRIMPLRRMVSARKPIANSVPTKGSDFSRRRPMRRPAQRPTRCVLVIRPV
jgi:hypothetical protein